MRFNGRMESDEASPVDEVGRERRERFGRLPARVRPSDTEESVDTRGVPERPAAAMNRNQVVALFDGA